MLSVDEGGKQGDSLMPALYSLGVRDALAEVQAGLEPSELLLAYLDDVYIVARPDRVRFPTLWRTACIRLMARRGSGTLLAGSFLESPHLLLGRACRGPRPAACWLPPVCRSSARRPRCKPARAPRSCCRLLGCICCSAALLGATMSCVCSRLSPRQSSLSLLQAGPLPAQALGVARLLCGLVVSVTFCGRRRPCCVLGFLGR